MQFCKCICVFEKILSLHGEVNDSEIPNRTSFNHLIRNLRAKNLLFELFISVNTRVLFFFLFISCVQFSTRKFEIHDLFEETKKKKKTLLIWYSYTIRLNGGMNS